MRSHTQLIPLDELILEPVRGAPRSIPPVDRPVGQDYPFALVIITPEKRVIAGHAYLKAYRASGQNVVPCCVADAEEIDLLLTRLHNRILFEDLPEEQLGAHLDLYTVLCRYRQSHAELKAAGSGIPGGGQDQNRASSASVPGEESEPAPSDAGHPALPAGPSELRDWHRGDPFWFF
jgi:hypothetical protein